MQMIKNKLKKIRIYIQQKFFKAPIMMYKMKIYNALCIRGLNLEIKIKNCKQLDN